MRILERIKTILAENQISAEISEEGGFLTALFPEELTGQEIPAVLSLSSVGGEDIGMVFELRFLIADTSHFSSEERQRLLMGCAMLNATLPAGNYGYDLGEDYEEEDTEAVETLVYRLGYPLGGAEDEDWICDQIMTAVTVSATVISDTAEPLLSVAAGKMSEEEFVEKYLA